jgi:acyl-CoA synthetase (AMP-forming)/AMP-acid ligase II
MITLGLPVLYSQIAALKGAAKFQTLVVCSIEDFLPPPVARAFGPAADRVGGAGREIEFVSLIDNDGAFNRHPHSSLEDEVVVLQFTGGTTGEPKGAMLTHANFCAVLNIFNHWDRNKYLKEWRNKLAKYEMPTEMEIRASLPKTPVGKLSTKELLAEEIAKRQVLDVLPVNPPEVA